MADTHIDKLGSGGLCTLLLEWHQLPQQTRTLVCLLRTAGGRGQLVSVNVHREAVSGFKHHGEEEPAVASFHKH